MEFCCVIDRIYREFYACSLDYAVIVVTVYKEDDKCTFYLFRRSYFIFPASIDITLSLFLIFL